MIFSEYKNEKNRFYEVTKEEIQRVENDLQLKLPSELTEFYKEVGYGFLDSGIGNINRLMDPLSIRDFRLRQNDFEFYPDIEIYDEFEKDKLVFFEVNESILFSIELINDEKQRIFLYDSVIAESLKKFLEEFVKNEDFYSALL